MNLDACLSIGDGETAVFSWFELHVHTARHSKIIVRNGGKGSEGRGKGRGGEKDGTVTDNCNKASRVEWEQVTQKVWGEGGNKEVE